MSKSIMRRRTVCLQKEAERRHVIISMCQHCYIVTKEIDAGEASPGVSHGICDTCLDKYYPEEEV